MKSKNPRLSEGDLLLWQGHFDSKTSINTYGNSIVGIVLLNDKTELVTVKWFHKTKQIWFDYICSSDGSDAQWEKLS